MSEIDYAKLLQYAEDDIVGYGRNSKIGKRIKRWKEAIEVLMRENARYVVTDADLKCLLDQLQTTYRTHDLPECGHAIDVIKSLAVENANLAQNLKIEQRKGARPREDWRLPVLKRMQDACVCPGELVRVDESGRVTPVYYPSIGGELPNQPDGKPGFT